MMPFGAFMVGVWGLLLCLLAVVLLVEGFCGLARADRLQGRLGWLVVFGGVAPAVFYVGLWCADLAVRGAW